MSYILITHPRARGDLAARIFGFRNADGFVAQWTALNALIGSISTASNLLDAAGGGVVDRFTGDGWRECCHQWSELLAADPELKIIFMVRDQAATEISMEIALQAVVPRYEACAGRSVARMLKAVECMRDFNLMNPSRTALIDSDCLLGFDGLSESLGKFAGTLDFSAWEQAIAVKTHDRQAIANVQTVDDIDWDSIPEAEPAEDVSVSATRYNEWVPSSGREAFAGSVEVHTLRYGSADWLADCAPTLDQWCDRHGYALRVHGKPVGLPDEKFAVLDMIREFLNGPAECMIFVDADVLVHPNAPGWPNLGNGFSILAETFEPTLEQWEKWKRKHRIVRNGWRYRNSGVWSCDRESAARFLAACTGPMRTGFREQHQFNLWLGEAHDSGMILNDLPTEWNRLIQVDFGPAWFAHLAGKKKEQTIREYRQERFLPASGIEDFEPHPSLSERAIVYPWRAEMAAWDELRYSLRSVHQHFKDTSCPIYVIGPAAPRWLQPNSRVKFIAVPGRRGRKNIRETTRIGTTIAETVLWMNDDVCLFSDADWSDFEVALTQGKLKSKIGRLQNSENPFHRGLANAAIDLMHWGIADPLRFATHTPYRFERERMIEVLRKFELPYKGGLETLYFNWHRAPSQPRGSSCVSDPLSPARFLNYSDGHLTEEFKMALAARFPDPAPWEISPSV